MKKLDAWEEFEATGSVLSYIKYRGITDETESKAVELIDNENIRISS